MVPGILVLLLTMVGTKLTAINIVKEKEIGTIEQINVTLIKKYHFILGKLILFWLLGLLVLTIGLTIARVAYGIIPAGSFITIYAFAAMYLLAVLGLGLYISKYSVNQQLATLLSFYLMMIIYLVRRPLHLLRQHARMGKMDYPFQPRIVLYRSNENGGIKRKFIS